MYFSWSSSWMFGLCTFWVRRTRKLRKCFSQNERFFSLFTLNPLIETTNTLVYQSLLYWKRRELWLFADILCILAQTCNCLNGAELWNYHKSSRFRLENLQFFPLFLFFILFLSLKKIAMQIIHTMLQWEQMWATQFCGSDFVR